MMSMEGNVATKLIEAAIEKGYKTHIFCFGESVTALKSGQAPKRFPNLGEDLQKLVKKGLKISVCSTCADARGFTQDLLIEGAKIGSLTNAFAAFLDDSDKVVTLGR